MAGDPLEVEDTAQSEVADKLGRPQNVFGFLEGNGVEGKINDTFVVGGHARGAIDGKVKVQENVTEEQDLFGRSAHGEVFGLGARHGH